MSHGETPDTRARRKVRETTTRLLGDAGALLLADSLGGTPAEIEGNGERLALAIGLAIARACDALRLAEPASKERATFSDRYLEAANAATLDGEPELAAVLMRAALRSTGR